MSLSPEERLEGREFRKRARQLMEQAFAEMPDTTEVRPVFLNFVRHQCSKHAGRTWAVQMREFIVFSPGEALFGYIWRAGSCPCGFTVRSAGGRLVLAGDRYPLHGAVEVKLES